LAGVKTFHPNMLSPEKTSQKSASGLLTAACCSCGGDWWWGRFLCSPCLLSKCSSWTGTTWSPTAAVSVTLRWFQQWTTLNYVSATSNFTNLFSYFFL